MNFWFNLCKFGCWLASLVGAFQYILKFMLKSFIIIEKSDWGHYLLDLVKSMENLKSIPKVLRWWLIQSGHLIGSEMCQAKLHHRRRFVDQCTSYSWTFIRKQIELEAPLHIQLLHKIMATTLLFSLNMI